MKCIEPQYRKRKLNGVEYKYTHPCGKCEACLITHKEAWTARGILEMLDYPVDGASFITLTYDQEHLPLRMVNGQIIGVLEQNDIQKFFKRLRKQTGRKYRYICAAEYGDKGDRPHYHIVLYGHRSQDIETIKKAWSDKDGQLIGNIRVDPITVGRVSYVLKYALKRLGAATTDIGGKPPEFALMSRRPGIGLNATPYFVDAIYRTARDTKREPLDIFVRDFTNIRIGGKTYPIHATLRKKVFEGIQARIIEDSSVVDWERIERKFNLARAFERDFELSRESLVMRDIELRETMTKALRKLECSKIRNNKLE
jgi:hypothetical protein